MVPRASILCRIPVIDERVTRSDRTLRNSIDSIHMHGVKLSDPMPMYARAIEGEIVVHSDMEFLYPLLAGQQHPTLLSAYDEKSILTSPQQACIQGPGNCPLNNLAYGNHMPSAL